MKLTHGKQTHGQFPPGGAGPGPGVVGGGLVISIVGGGGGAIGNSKKLFSTHTNFNMLSITVGCSWSCGDSTFAIWALSSAEFSAKIFFLICCL